MAWWGTERHAVRSREVGPVTAVAASTTDAITEAVTVELVHDFASLHDDITAGVVGGGAGHRPGR